MRIYSIFAAFAAILALQPINATAQQARPADTPMRLSFVPLVRFFLITRR